MNMKPLTPEQQLAQTAQLLKMLADDMQTAAYKERNAVLALDRFHRFQAHVKAGFTEAQALELVK